MPRNLRCSLKVPVDFSPPAPSKETSGQRRVPSIRHVYLRERRIEKCQRKQRYVEQLSTSARLVAVDAAADAAARLTTFLITLWALVPEDPTQWRVPLETSGLRVYAREFVSIRLIP